jgi:hypothetical protein
LTTEVGYKRKCSKKVLWIGDWLRRFQGKFWLQCDGGNTLLPDGGYRLSVTLNIGGNENNESFIISKQRKIQGHVVCARCSEEKEGVEMEFFVFPSYVIFSFV